MQFDLFLQKMLLFFVLNVINIEALFVELNKRVLGGLL